jgi:TolA-binding protein
VEDQVSNKPLNISESAAVQMPMKTVASLIVLVAMGVFAYTELTSRLVSLETSRELFENDLLKKSEQVPVDQEQHFLLEDLYKSVEQIETRIEDMMHNKVNIQFIQKQTEKLLEDVEVLKDKVRQNGNGAH